MRAFFKTDFMRQGALIFAATMIFNVASYALHLTVSRLLGVSRYGELLALVSILYIFGAFGTIANNVVARLAAEHYALHRAADLRALSTFFVRLSVVVIVVVTAIGFISTVFVSSYLRIDEGLAVGWTFFALGLTIALPGLRGILQGEHRFRAYSISIIIEGVGRLLIGVPLVLAGFSVTGAIAAWALAALISLTYAVIVVMIGPRVTEAARAINLREVLWLVGGVSGATIAVAVLTSADVLLVKHFFSPHDAGIFAITSVAGKALMFIVSFVPMLVLPRAAAAAAAGRPAMPMFVQAMALTAVLSAAGVLGFAVLSVPIVRALGGNSFVDASKYLALYGLATAVLCGINVCVAYCLALHRLAFVLPLVAVAVGEVIAISAYHPTLDAVVLVLTIANTIGLLTVAALSVRSDTIVPVAAVPMESL
jgi:O-antigen/teichoic acid export membrane protein